MSLNIENVEFSNSVNVVITAAALYMIVLHVKYSVSSVTFHL